MLPIKSINSPNTVASKFWRAYTLGNTPFKIGLLFSMASIAVSTITPILGNFAWLTNNDQRAVSGTKKMFSAVYSSCSSGSPHSSATNSWYFSSKESLMYFKKIKPKTTCLYSAASIFLRSLSAAFHKTISSASCLISFFAFAITIYFIHDYNIYLLNEINN